MAEEDLIFGKNRHMFGGIEPSNMLEFSVARNAYGKIEITAQLPNETTVNGQLLCTVGGAVIRRKTSGYPVDEFDGDLVTTIRESGTVIDSNANADGQYFYAAFPFSTQGVYNRSYANRAQYKYAGVEYYFGFDLDMNDSNPATRVTYPSDTMNYKFSPAYMNSSTDTFTYGSWPSTPGKTFMPRPCIVTVDSTSKKSRVSYYLNPNDYSKSINGTAIPGHGTRSDYTKYMVEWPKIYTHREVANGIYKFRCCNKPLGDGWDCICNYDADGNQINHFYMAAYQGAYAYSGALPHVDTSTYITPSAWVATIRDKYGSDWNPAVLADRLLVQDLLIMMAKTTDLSTAYHCWNWSRNGINGMFDTKGMFYGDAAANYVKVFGIEHFWSNEPSEDNDQMTNTPDKLLLGLLAVPRAGNARLMAKFTSSTHDGSQANDYNFTGNGYIEASVGFSRNYLNGYSYNMRVFTNAGRIPNPGEYGSSTTYECTDYSFSKGLCVATYGNGLRSSPFSLQTVVEVNDIFPDDAIVLSYKPKEGNHSVI